MKRVLFGSLIVITAVAISTLFKPSSLPQQIPPSQLVTMTASPSAEITTPSPLPTPTQVTATTTIERETPENGQAPQLNLFLKDVGEAYLDHFGLTEGDFQQMLAAGVVYIQGNFDICATDEDVKFFLNMAQKHRIKVIMPAGSGEAEWGYVCDVESIPENQAPSWQKAQVQAWIKKWKNHPSVAGWDISNEAGSVMPNSERFMLTAAQLKQAYIDVKAADSGRPVLIRMNGWFFYENEDNPFIGGNPFAAGVADIVMVNAYSNVSDYYSDFVETVLTRAKTQLRRIDPKVRIFAALGAWNEPPLWKTPSVQNLGHDVDSVRKVGGIESIGFFKYGAAKSEWYMPDSKIGAPNVWQFIRTLQRR